MVMVSSGHVIRHTSLLPSTRSLRFPSPVLSLCGKNGAMVERQSSVVYATRREQTLIISFTGWHSTDNRIIIAAQSQEPSPSKEDKVTGLNRTRPFRLLPEIIASRWSVGLNWVFLLVFYSITIGLKRTVFAPCKGMRQTTGLNILHFCTMICRLFFSLKFRTEFDRGEAGLLHMFAVAKPY